jgi:hypothetical protein
LNQSLDVDAKGLIFYMYTKKAKLALRVIETPLHFLALTTLAFSDPQGAT